MCVKDNPVLATPVVQLLLLSLILRLLCGKATSVIQWHKLLAINLDFYGCCQPEPFGLLMQHFQTSSPLKPLSRLKSKFHVEPSLDGGTQVCSIGPGHMTKMAAMTIYGKTLQKENL